MNQDVLLEVDNLHTWFADNGKIVQAVNGVTFSLRHGEVLGLVGESGCGKSSTCRSIIGLVQHGGLNTQGRILYNGQDLLQFSEREMAALRGKEISMIFQEPMNALNPVTTIGEQLAESMIHLNLSKDEVRKQSIDMLRLVGIASPELRLGFYPHQLSGGMRQRAMIAIALAPRPKLLLADEPTTALDVTIQDQIMKLLLRLIKELGMSLILVTHNLGVASAMCDSIAVMYAGHIVERASAHDLFYFPRHPYTYGLICSLPMSKAEQNRLTPIMGTPPDLSRSIQGCPFAPRCIYAEARCRQELPQQVEVGKDHVSSCFYLDKLQNLPAVVEGPQPVTSKE